MYNAAIPVTFLMMSLKGIRGVERRDGMGGGGGGGGGGGNPQGGGGGGGGGWPTGGGLLTGVATESELVSGVLLPFGLREIPTTNKSDIEQQFP